MIGITDNLSDTVVGHFSSTVRLVQHHVTRFQFTLIQQDGPAVASSSDSQGMRMLQQQQRVWLLATLYQAAQSVFEGLVQKRTQRVPTFGPKAFFHSSCNQIVMILGYSNRTIVRIGVQEAL